MIAKIQLRPKTASFQNLLDQSEQCLGKGKIADKKKALKKVSRLTSELLAGNPKVFETAKLIAENGLQTRDNPGTDLENREEWFQDLLALFKSLDSMMQLTTPSDEHILLKANKPQVRKEIEANIKKLSLVLFGIAKNIALAEVQKTRDGKELYIRDFIHVIDALLYKYELEHIKTEGFYENSYGKLKTYLDAYNEAIKPHNRDPLPLSRNFTNEIEGRYKKMLSTLK